MSCYISSSAICNLSITSWIFHYVFVCLFLTWEFDIQQIGIFLLLKPKAQLIKTFYLHHQVFTEIHCRWYNVIIYNVCIRIGMWELRSSIYEPLGTFVILFNWPCWISWIFHFIVYPHHPQCGRSLVLLIWNFWKFALKYWLCKFCPNPPSEKY